MEVPKEGGHMGEISLVEHEACLSVLGRFDRGGNESSQERVAVFEERDDERLD